MYTHFPTLPSNKNVQANNEKRYDYPSLFDLFSRYIRINKKPMNDHAEFIWRSSVAIRFVVCKYSVKQSRENELIQISNHIICKQLLFIARC